MWIYPRDCANWRTLISIGRYDDGLLWRMGTGGDQLYFNGTYWNFGATSIPLNQWSHLALVRNNGTIKTYINGIESFSYNGGAAASDLGSSRDVYIGTGKHSYGSEIFNGYIDEVRITKGIGTARYSSNFDVKTLLAPFPSSGTPITPPEVITSLSGSPGGNKITLLWTPPAEDNGDAISNYSVQYSSDEGSSWSDFTHSASSSSSIAVSGLTNGTSYLARVAPINIAGTGSYVSLESSISPLTPPVLTITSQPLNDYSINSNSAPSISVSATMSNGDTPTYQWQGYYYNYNTDYYGWNNFTDQTSSVFNLTPNSAANNYNLYDIYYGGTVQVRCIVSGNRVESPITTPAVRWFQIDQQHYPNTSWYTNNYNGPSWNGYSNPMSITLGAVDNLNLDLYDYAYGTDTSWFTGNDITVKIQISDNNSSWTDLYTQNFRGYFYLYNYQIPTSYGIKYYRIKVISKWPYTTNNGTGSVSHSPPYEWSSTQPYDVLRVTWPLPSQPLNVVSDPGDTLVDVSWNAPTNSATTVTSYTVQYSSNGGNSWTTFGTTASTSLMVTGLSNGTDYVFRVAATNSAGTGSYSSASSSVAPDVSYATTPGVPTNITGIAGNTKVLLNWIAPSDIGKSALTDYTVQYSTDDGETWENYTDPTPAPFDPSLLSNLQLWLDASDSNTLYDDTSSGSLVAADGAVARWEDKSGNNRHFIQSDSSKRPLRKINQQNNLDTLLLDGTNDSMVGGNYLNLYGSGGITVFIVVKQNSSSEEQYLLNKYGESSGEEGWLIQFLSPSTLRYYVANTSTDSAGGISSTSSVDVSGYTVLTTKASYGSSGSVLLYRNGVGLNTTGSIPASTTDNNFPIRIGQYVYGSTEGGFAAVNMAEIIIYNAALSDTDRAAVETYLINKWGIV